MEKRQEQNRRYREKNKVKISVYLKIWRQNNKSYIKDYRVNNKDRILTKYREWKSKNRDKILASKKRWYSKYRDKILEYHNEYYHKNRGRLLKEMRAYQKRIRPIRTAYENAYRKKRELADPIYLLGRRLRGRARIAFTRSGTRKEVSCSELLGCSYKEARLHIEKLFKDGMSWDNYGKWHVDHIKPLNSFDLIKPEEQKVAFNYMNLQPLWAKDNLIKGSKSEMDKK